MGRGCPGRLEGGAGTQWGRGRRGSDDGDDGSDDDDDDGNDNSTAFTPPTPSPYSLLSTHPRLTGTAALRRDTCRLLSAWHLITPLLGQLGTWTPPAQQIRPLPTFTAPIGQALPRRS